MIQCHVQTSTWKKGGGGGGEVVKRGTQGFMNLLCTNETHDAYLSLAP